MRQHIVICSNLSRDKTPMKTISHDALLPKAPKLLELYQTRQEDPHIVEVHSALSWNAHHPLHRHLPALASHLLFLQGLCTFITSTSAAYHCVALWRRVSPSGCKPRSRTALTVMQRTAAFHRQQRVQDTPVRYLRGAIFTKSQALALLH